MIDECDTGVMLLVAKLADMCLQKAIKQWSAKRVRIRFCFILSDTKPQLLCEPLRKESWVPRFRKRNFLILPAT